MEGIAAETKELLGIASKINSRVQNLATSTKEISTSTGAIEESVEQVRGRLESLLHH